MVHNRRSYRRGVQRPSSGKAIFPGMDLAPTYQRDPAGRLEPRSRMRRVNPEVLPLAAYQAVLPDGCLIVLHPQFQWVQLVHTD